MSISRCLNGALNLSNEQLKQLQLELTETKRLLKYFLNKMENPGELELNPMTSIIRKREARKLLGEL